MVPYCSLLVSVYQCFVKIRQNIDLYILLLQNVGLFQGLFPTVLAAKNYSTRYIRESTEYSSKKQKASSLLWNKLS